MNKTLLMRFAGPIQGYGTSQSQQKIRDTALEPPKAAVIGAVCAALGKDREQDGKDGLPTLATLCALLYGVRVDRDGTLHTDFQTAGIDGMLSAENTPRGSGNVTFTRYFLANADFLVGLYGPEELLKQISDALTHPRWAPCLGRRGCVPHEPLRLPDGGIREAGLVEALKAHPVKRSGQVRFVIEVPVGSGTRLVTDVPLSFSSSSRRFGMREVKEWFENMKETEVCFSPK